MDIFNFAIQFAFRYTRDRIEFNILTRDTTERPKLLTCVWSLDWSLVTPHDKRHISGCLKICKILKVTKIYSLSTKTTSFCNNLIVLKRVVIMHFPPFLQPCSSSTVVYQTLTDCLDNVSDMF